MLKSKIHRATVTGAYPDYTGSITIDSALLKSSDILPYERVQVVNVNNGERFETYAIEGPANSGAIELNGAAARLVLKGDKVIIIAYQYLDESAARKVTPRLVLVDDHNKIHEIKKA